jgi:transcription antitermination factor NusG
MSDVWEVNNMNYATRWCILRTSGPSTLRLTASLQAAGFDAWTPTEHVRRRVPRCKNTEYRVAPLAPTYVFVRAGHLAELQRIERADITPHPRFSIFRFRGETVFIRHGEMHPLRVLQQRSYVASLPSTGRSPGKPRGEPFTPGMTVSFAQGPLTGLEGYVETSDGRTTRLAITLFGRTSAVEVETLHLRSLNVPAEKPAA